MFAVTLKPCKRVRLYSDENGIFILRQVRLLKPSVPFPLTEQRIPPHVPDMALLFALPKDQIAAAVSGFAVTVVSGETQL